jgi:hypothetical protein
VDESHRLLRQARLPVPEDEPALLDQVDGNSAQLGRPHDAEGIERLCRDPRPRQHACELAAPGRSFGVNRSERRSGELQPWPRALDMPDDSLLELADTLARVPLGRAGSRERRRASTVPAEATRNRASLLCVESGRSQHVGEFVFEHGWSRLSVVGNCAPTSAAGQQRHRSRVQRLVQTNRFFTVEDATAAAQQRAVAHVLRSLRD